MIGAVDIGGTKTLVAVFTDEGKIKEQNRFETAQNYQDFLMDLAKTVDNLATKDFKKFVVAVPGRLDREGGLALGYGTLRWDQESIAADIESMTHCPVVIENDAKLAGLSEAINIMSSYRKVLYITIGTGISCALITDGKISHELEDSEGGQILVDYRGQMKQWEDVVSGRAIVERFGKRASDINDKATWKLIAHDLGLGIIDLVSVLQPDVIVMGGGVNTNYDKYIDYLKDDLKRYQTPLVPIPPIKKAKRPEEAVIYGCYEMAKARKPAHARNH